MATVVKEKNRKTHIPVIPPVHGNGNGSKGWGGGMSHSRSNYSLPIHPAKLGLWLFIAASMMLFAAFTSAYIVRSSAGDWVRVGVPTVMWFGTAALILSSVSIHSALRSVKAGQYTSFRNFLLTTVVLGCIFVAGQVIGWNQMRAAGVFLDTNASSSFFYVLTVTHIVHVIGGGAALAFVTFKALRRKYSADNYLGVELCATYWHFLDALWVYLFLFLLIV